jgi:hypothetical protein
MSDEFLAIGKKEGIKIPRHKQKWSRLAQNILKINTDGAFTENTEEGGWGYVIRDDRGVVIDAGAGRAEFLMDAFHSDVLACLMGVKAAVELGISKVHVETKSLTRKLALETSNFELAPTGGIVFEIKSLMNSMFSSRFVFLSKSL